MILVFASSVRLCSAYSAHHGKTIGNIVIEAAPSINKKEMLWLLEFKPGDLYSEKKIQKSIEAMYLKNFFSNIIVEANDVGENVDITFTLIPKTRVKDIHFLGYDHFYKSELRKVLAIREGAELNVRRVKDSIKRLERLYKGEGFLNPSIGYDVITLDEDQYEKSLVFNIDEGEHAIIKSITLDFPDIKLDEEEIRDVLDIEPGDRFNDKIIQTAKNDLEKYLIEGRFFDLDRIKFDYEGKAQIDLKVTIDVPYRVEVIFIGNDEYSDKKLFSFFNFEKHKSSDIKIVRNFIEDIREFYYENGFYFARISVDEYMRKEERETVKNEKVINVHISEGKRIEIKSVNFAGNELYSDKRLLKQMLSRESGTFFNEYLVQRTLDDDINALKFLYQKNGYQYINIEHEKVFSEDKSEVEISIKINEGEQTIITDVSYEGISDERFTTIYELTKGKEGHAVNIYRLEDEKAAISKYYKELGYYKVKVETKETFLRDNKMQITYVIDEGIKARIGKLIISNNDFTKKKVIRRESGLERGDPYTLNTLLMAKQKVYRLGFFNYVDINSISDEDDEVKDLLIEVKERDSGAVEVGFGYATEERLRGYIEVGHKNIAGYGRAAAIRAEADAKSRKFTLFFQEPWLFNHPYDASVFVSDQYLKTESYTLRKFATAVAITRDFTQTIQGVLQYEIEFDKLMNVESEAVAIPEDVGTNRIHTVSPYLVRDSRDDPFNPSRGSFNSLRFDYAGREVGSQLRFQKLSGRLSNYFPLRRNIILALAVRGGYGFSLGDEPELPINKRFFLGGRNTVRGFAPDEIGPKGASDVPIGGNVMVNYNAEFRISFGKSWGGIIFYDAGNVWAETKDFEPNDVRDAVGLGMRYVTVAGPLSLDVGRKLDREAGEPLTEWYFTIGNIF